MLKKIRLFFSPKILPVPKSHIFIRAKKRCGYLGKCDYLGCDYFECLQYKLLEINSKILNSLFTIQKKFIEVWKSL